MIVNVLVMLIASASTYFLNNIFNPILSASIIGLIAGMCSRKYSIPAYIGAFIGMSSYNILSLPLLVLASLIVSIIWHVIMVKIPSLGGKAGFTAFLGVLIINMPTIWEMEYSLPFYVDVLDAILLILVSILSTEVTFFLRKKFKLNEVLSSALVGFFSGSMMLFFPSVKMFSEIAFASSFAGMTHLKFLKEDYHSLLIGVIVGVVFILSLPLFQGFGGKLGSIAFISVLLFLFLMD